MVEVTPAEPSTAPLVSVRGLTVSFQTMDRPAVDGISLEVRAGECVALVGESGSGKSLTARAIIGLLPRAAKRTGEVLLQGDPAPENSSAAWNKIRGRVTGLVPQDALGALDPLRRIEHEVGDSLRLHERSTRTGRRARVVTALSEAGMPHPEAQLRKRSDELSGGLRQRALVASALISRPNLIVADEPTTALDAGHRGRVLAEIKRRVREGAGALLISHDLVSVRDTADRVLVMRAGKIVEQGTPAAVFANPTHPFTKELIAAAPGLVPRGTRLLRAHQETVEVHETTTASAPDSTAAPRIELSGVSAGYGVGARRATVLRNVNLSVYRGETVGLVGESGSGKTTLLRIALGLLAPSEGNVFVDGRSRTAATHSEQRELQKRVSFVPQDPLASFPRAATGRALLTDALRAAGVARQSREMRSRELAYDVGLDRTLLDLPAVALSGGQRQRLAIARALAREPELLLLDEPVSALDITVQARVLDLLDDLQQLHGTAYLLVSHDEDVITHMSDRVVTLAAGTIQSL